MRYTVDFRPSARKSLVKLPHRDQVRVITAADALSGEPRPAGAKKLIAEENLWRIRVGDYRVIYKVEDAKLLILVLKIGHRKDIYR
jgi:mRNA interferase RelE/StbE